MGVISDDKIVKLLTDEEGLRLHVYDDATGKPIVPGSHVVGHPTVGYGIALDTGGITEAEATTMLANRIDVIRAELDKTRWFVGLDIVRQHAMICMAFQLGVPGTLAFKTMCSALYTHDYKAASVAMLDSLWAKQTPARANRVAAMILTGQYAVVP